MVNRDIVASKLAELKDRIERVRKRVPASADKLGEDRDALDIVSFNLMLSVQICADIATHIIADEAWPPAKTLSEGFARLRERGVVSSATEAKLKQAIGLRNVVAHGYAGIDVAKCYEAATSGPADLERFAVEVARWVAASAEPSLPQ